jgi:hypothetical protein
MRHRMTVASTVSGYGSQGGMEYPLTPVSGARSGRKAKAMSAKSNAVPTSNTKAAPDRLVGALVTMIEQAHHNCDEATATLPSSSGLRTT